MSTQNHFRQSTETDRRHLLSDSLVSSEAASIASTVDDVDDGERTPRARSPMQSSQTLSRHASIAAPEQAHVQAPYRGFSSEQAYLEALQAWADNKKYDAPHGNTLLGFYGATTMEEYASRPPAFQGLGLRKKWRARKASKVQEQQKSPAERRATIA